MRRCSAADVHARGVRDYSGLVAGGHPASAVERGDPPHAPALPSSGGAARNFAYWQHNHAVDSMVDHSMPDRGAILAKSRKPEFYPIILAGGRGTRFWPLSRKSFAKQLLPLNSGSP